MQREWTLRQILAIVRGIGVMVGLFWMLVAVQFVPALWRGGLGGRPGADGADRGDRSCAGSLANRRDANGSGVGDYGCGGVRTVFVAENLARRLRRRR